MGNVAVEGIGGFVGDIVDASVDVVEVVVEVPAPEVHVTAPICGTTVTPLIMDLYYYLVVALALLTTMLLLHLVSQFEFLV